MFTTLLNDPLYQASLVPFATALLAGVVLNFTARRWLALAVMLGFYVSAWQIVDLRFIPFTSTRKIILLGFIATLAGAVFDLSRGTRRGIAPALVSIGGGLTALWVIWPVLSRKSGMESGLLAGGASLYCGWLITTCNALRTQPLRAGSAILAVALGTGISALLGTSALLGQLSTATAAAAGAYLLVALFTPHPGSGALLTTPPALLCGLFGLSAFVYARLPWSALPILALIPLLAQIPLPAATSSWKRVFLLMLLLLPAAGVAVLVTLRAVGPPEF